MGGLARKIKRKRESPRERTRRQLNEMNRIIANAMREQLEQIGVDPKKIDPEKDIQESSRGDAKYKVRHFHYKGQLLVEVIRTVAVKGFDYQVRVPRRKTDGEVIKDKDGNVSVN